MLDKSALSELKSLKQQIRDENPIYRGIVKSSQGRHGFVHVDALKRNIYIDADTMLRVFPGDEIELKISKDKQDRDVAKLEKLISSELKQCFGLVIKKGNNTFIVPDLRDLSRWLFVPPNKLNGAVEGDLVKAKISRHPFKNGKSQTQIIEVIAHKTAPKAAQLYAIAKHELAGEWNEEILKGLDAHAEKRFDELKEQATDLRDRHFITIDSASSRDLDDALFVESQSNGWSLSVAISDASAFVDEGNSLDRGMRERANSVYLPGHVMHMMPAILSEASCSLLPNQDRLALVAKLEIRADGELIAMSIEQGLISSKAKLSYPFVQSILDGNADETLEEFNDTNVQQVLQLHELHLALNAWRDKNALQTQDRPDYHYNFDNNFNVQGMTSYNSTTAHKIVEECMVLTNRAVAEYMMSHNIPGIFNTHAGFKPERIDGIHKVMKKHTDHGDLGDITELGAYIELMSYTKQLEHEESLYALLGKQFDRSELSAQASPHMGLGFKAYSSFTSPIRKYQDLLLHRIIKQHLANQAVEPIDNETLAQINEQIVKTRMATRLCDRWLQASYAATIIDQEAQALVTHVNSRAITVRLVDSGVEAAIETRQFKQKFRFDSQLMKMDYQDKCYRLNDIINVKISKVDSIKHEVFCQLI